MALRNGIRLPVGMAEVFPYGCCLVPDSIVEAQDYDERTGRRTPAVDRVTGKRVFQCRVSDLDPELAGRSRETVVKILADQQPQPPTRPPFEQVVTVPVDGRSLVAFQRTVTVPPHVLPVLAEHMASWAGPDRVFVGVMAARCAGMQYARRSTGHGGRRGCLGAGAETWRGAVFRSPARLWLFAANGG